LGEEPYKASLVHNNQENSGAVVLDNRALRRNDTLTIEMAGGGGFVGRFAK